MVKFNSTKNERKLMDRIAQRAAGELQVLDRVSLLMDLDAVNSNDTRLDFVKLLGADTFNFAHDVCGIMRHIDRTTGKLTRRFLPRCSKKEKNDA